MPPVGHALFPVNSGRSPYRSNAPQPPLAPALMFPSVTQSEFASATGA